MPASNKGTKQSLKKESQKTIKEYLTNNPITNVPFEQRAVYPFKIKKIRVRGASISRISYSAKVNITKDIFNNWGFPPGLAKNCFAYFKAVDKVGRTLSHNGVLMNATQGPFKTNMEVELHGSLGNLANMANFEKLVFISKEDYDKIKL